MPAQSSHPKYRRDIDGLRAIAILSVVAFHAFPNWIKGGFIGVDVFFVISGYLISTIVFENLVRDTFSFAEFYARRVKRIVPALILVLVSCLAFGWVTLLAGEYQELGLHTAGGAAFVTNLLSWTESGYFAGAADTKPLLHLWSLGVEEQFYIVWPILLWFVYKLGGSLLKVCIYLAAASFFLNIYESNIDTAADFYFPQTRFWELMLGSILAWVTLYIPDFSTRTFTKLSEWFSKAYFRDQVIEAKNLSSSVSVLGLLLLAYGFWYLDKDFVFPGKWALIPVGGTLLVIIAGQEAWVNRVILSNSVAVWVGLISFPLYLWHWPLLTFARIIGSGTPGVSIRVAVVLLSVALAWLTYRLIEQPIRTGPNSRAKVTVLVLLVVMVGFLGFGIFSQSGLSFREVEQINASKSSGVDGGDQGNMVKECGIKDGEIRRLFRLCIQDKRGNIRFALMGDSKAEALYPGLVRTSSETGRWLVIGGHGFNGAPFPMLSADPDPNRPLTNYAVEAIANNRDIDTVVLVTAIRALFSLSDGVTASNRATYDYTYLRLLDSSPRFDGAFSELDRVVRKFIDKGKKVVLVVDNPVLPERHDCINRLTSSIVLNTYLGKSNDACVVPEQTFNKQIVLYRKLLEKIKSEHAGWVEIFDPTDIYCDTQTGFCSYIKNNRFMYALTDHISDYASGLVGSKLNQFLALK